VCREVACSLRESVPWCCLLLPPPAAFYCCLLLLLLPPTAGLFAAGVLIPRLSVGLDQAVALPRDSYMQDYYRWVGAFHIPLFSLRGGGCNLMLVCSTLVRSFQAE
jgi:hypothetical protein